MPDYELRMGDIPELQLAVTERRPAWGARVLEYDSSATGIDPVASARKEEGRGFF